MEPTTDPKQIREAINNRPELFEAILSSNPLLAQMLAAGLCLSERPETALAQAVSKLPEPSVPAATPSGIAVTLQDNRGGAVHEAYLFSLAPTQRSVRAELKALLGEKAVEKLFRYEGPKRLDKPLAEETHIAIFTNSNNKPVSRTYSTPDDVTTQQDDMLSAGYELADDRVPLLLCARLLHKIANENVQLTDAQQDLLEKLKRGSIRSKSGTIAMDEHGDLIALGPLGNASPLIWACGTPS